MKKIYVIFSLLLTCAMGFGQSFSLQLVGSAGDQSDSGPYQVSWSIGEAVTDGGSAGGLKLTQGFQQVYFPPVAPGIKPYWSNSCGTCYTCWWPSGGSYPATYYLLDVSTNAGFTSFVGTYHDLNVGNVTTYLVTGLTPGVTYYYRVRGGSVEGIGPYSGTFSFVM